MSVELSRVRRYVRDGRRLRAGRSHDELLRRRITDEHHRNAQAAFDAAESVCDSQYPACGCAAMGLDVEDGTLIEWSQHDAVLSSCDQGSCIAHYSGETFACADKRCTTEQICWITMGGPSGSGSSAMCNFAGGCSDCSCVGSVGCACSVDGGHVTVTCAAP